PLLLLRGPWFPARRWFTVGGGRAVGPILPKPSRLPRPMTPLLHRIADLSIPELAGQFRTPLYVYDAQVIVERIGHLASFDVTRYAQKACSNIAILDLARRNNVMVDAVSAGEIHRALAAGYKPGFDDPPQIVYTADIFDRE